MHISLFLLHKLFRTLFRPNALSYRCFPRGFFCPDFLCYKENIALQWRRVGHFAAAKYFTILMTPDHYSSNWNERPPQTEWMIGLGGDFYSHPLCPSLFYPILIYWRIGCPHQLFAHNNSPISLMDKTGIDNAQCIIVYAIFYLPPYSIRALLSGT
jgi:hypothetical protein